MSAEFAAEVAALAMAFPGAVCIGDPAQQLILLPNIEMSGEWTPGNVAALLNCSGWPEQRPKLLVADVLKRNGNPPPNFSPEYIEEKSWYSYSFNIPYEGQYPALIPVVRGFLARFDGRPS